jgi:ATP-binding cassette subfamily G (WHITE) protein 2 (SNQ2)
LDGTAAFEVIKTIRELADGSGGAFSVLLSIHQPNTRILSLFDHVLLLGNGGSVFFGSLHEAMVHFAEIGYECPENENPTDHILQVTDQSFARAEAIPRDFCQEYATSDMCKQMLRKLAESRALRASHWDADDDEEEHTRETTFGMQYWTLTKREAILAVRDPTLYYLQMVLHVVYGFMIGAVFWDLHPRLDDTLNYIPGASLWALMLCSYVHVFKIFYMVTANKRYEHERANASYGPVAFWLSELTVTFISQIIFIPGPLIAFYMIGFPASSYPWYLLVLTSAGMCAESMLNFISKFTESPAYAVVASQAVLVMLTVFGGGVFVPMNDIPGYWNWLAQLGVFTQGSQALMLRIFEGYNYVCPDGAIQGDSCVSGLATFPCDGEGTDLAAGVCEVSGITVIDINNGIAGDYWEYLGYLIVLFIMFRILVLILYIYPYKKIVRSLRKLTASYAQMAVLELQMDVKRLRGEVTALNTAVAKQGQFALPAYDPEIADDEVALLQGGDEEEGKAAHLMRARSSFDVRVPVFLTFEDVLVTLPTNGKVLIDSVSGFAESGHVLALMGPSGAGKTTLLNALSGRATYADVGGKVKLGSRPLSTDDLDYVPQFDSLNEAFTVTEILMYMAKLRTVGKGKRRRVLELINILGLTNKADFFIRDLSGGEKKRVSIGMGLVTQPPALFLDEPTTGR